MRGAVALASDLAELTALAAFLTMIGMAARALGA